MCINELLRLWRESRHDYELATRHLTDPDAVPMRNASKHAARAAERMQFYGDQLDARLSNGYEIPEDWA